MSSIGAVCFDLDGTLCVSAQDRDRLLAEAFADVGIDPLFDVADLWEIDTSALPTAETSLEFHTNLFLAGAERAGAGTSRETIESLAEAYLDHYDPTAVEFRDGARESLRRARESAPVGLVTNGGESTQSAKLATLDIEEAFDVRVYCDPAAGIEPKPDPRPLKLASRELGVPPERTLLVGDSLEADVAGARAAGMQSAWTPFGTQHGEPEPEPTYRLASPAELRDLL